MPAEAGAELTGRAIVPAPTPAEPAVQAPPGEPRSA
jgi:hypothetical protein